MCSVNVDGSAAAIIASEKKAKDSVYEPSDQGTCFRLDIGPVAGARPGNARCQHCTRKAAAAAYEMAGLGADDIDLVELHDCFATAEILHYENLGLCEDGGAGRMIDDGEFALGGKVPVNVSGGLLSKGHPLGRNRIANIYEVSTPLSGEKRDSARSRALELA
ncbi:MAG: hypothetical protein CM1200mP9_04400 [Gammaproteobacteria bacterium]|nr:MAG: hypothetical protein CM1200mP9_04400 [Gammaproteobacteria bacterium]